MGVIPSAQEYVATGVANPFAQNWIPAPNYRGNDTAFDSGNSYKASWYSFTVEVFGEAYFPTIAPPADLVQAALDSRNPRSFLKLQLKWPQGNSRIRTVRMDISTGLTVFIPPTWSVEATVLVPDPASIPDELPSSLNPDLSFSTFVVCTTRCVAAPAGRNTATDTQCYFINPDQASFSDPRQQDARVVQVFSDTVLDTATLQFVQDFAPQPDIQILGAFGTSLPAATTETRDSTYPGPANAVSYTPGAPPGGGQTVCVVQKLDF